MLKVILLIVLIVLAGLAIFVAMRPSEFTVKRAASVAAPPSVVFAHVADVRKFTEWSPWAKMDPEARNTFEGPGDAIGSSLTWQSRKTGEGTMTLIETKPDSKAVYALDFRKPFKAKNTAVFEVAPSAGGSEVTWSMTGRNNFLFKAVGLFMDTDKMVGGDFEKGLADLKKIAEENH